MKNLIVSAALLVAFATPSLADESYYVVRNSMTKKCTVVHEKPTSTTTTVVDGNKIYKTETEAQGAMKTTKICTDD